METTPIAAPNQVFFQRLFWTFPSCIKGFALCTPLVQVDGTWLYGTYRGTLLLVVAQDGNNHIFPVAFAIVERETKEACNFFLKYLRDRHASIKSAYENSSNGWNNPPSSHVYCIRHIDQNFVREIKEKNLRRYVTNMGYAPSESSFLYWRHKLAQQSAHALRWVDNIPQKKWTQAYDGGRRWDHMISNLAEAMNSVYKDIRSLPITTLVKSTYFKTATLFEKRATTTAAVLQSGQVFTEAFQERIALALTNSHSHKVNRFHRQHFTFVVEETEDPHEGRPMKCFQVNLQQKCCDCGKFQSLHLPCSHVIAACLRARLEYQIYIDDVYTTANVSRLYDNNFDVVRAERFWSKYQGPDVFVNPSMKRTKKGSPKKSRIRTEMDEFNQPKGKLCGLCREPGHRAPDCPNAAEPSS